MTEEKQHVDLSSIEPVFRGVDDGDADSRDTRQEGGGAGTEATPGGTPVVGATPGGPPVVGAFTETGDSPPPDPDDLDRLRRG